MVGTICTSWVIHCFDKNISSSYTFAFMKFLRRCTYLKFLHTYQNLLMTFHYCDFPSEIIIEVKCLYSVKR